MSYKIDYKLIKDSDSFDRDIKKLQCIINNDERSVIFEFSDMVLRFTDCLNLGKNPSAQSLYKTIEKFLIRELDNNTLQDRYFIGTKNFSHFCV